MRYKIYLGGSFKCVHIIMKVKNAVQFTKQLKIVTMMQIIVTKKDILTKIVPIINNCVKRIMGIHPLPIIINK